MNLELAKLLRYNDKIYIHYPNTNVLGRFESLSKNGYIHYFAPHTPPGQVAHVSIVGLHFDTKTRLIKEGLIEKPAHNYSSDVVIVSKDRKV
jgi:hypothetical protein